MVRLAAPDAAQDLSKPQFALLICAAVAVGGAFRFWHLAVEPLWMDEAFTYFAAQLDWPVLLFGQVDTHPPLYYGITKIWLLLDPSTLQLRVPAALFGVANIAVFGAVVARLHSRSAGAVAAAVLAMSSFHIWISRDARMYTLLLLELTLVFGAACAIAAGRGRRRTSLAVYLLGSVFALYTQVVSAVFIAGCASVWLVAALREAERRRLLLEFFIANGLLALAAVPMLVHVVELLGVYPGAGASDLGSARWFLGNVLGFPGLPGLAEPISKVLLMVLLLACMLAGWRKPGNRDLLLVVAAIGTLYGVAIIAAGAIVPLYSNRVFLPLVLPFATVLALGIADMRRSWIRWPVLLALLGTAFASSFNAHRFEEKYGNPAAAIAMAERRGYPDAPVLTCSLFAGMSTFLERGDHRVYQIRQDAIVRFDQSYLALLSRGLPWLMERPIAALAAASPDVIDRSREVQAFPALIVIAEPCNSGFQAASRQSLTQAGFKLSDSYSVANSNDPEIIQRTQTQVDLYRRTR